jgi:hypothetical protein
MKIKAALQSVHLTLGILRTSQAVSCALAFFQLDTFAVPAPALLLRKWLRYWCARPRWGRGDSPGQAVGDG